MTWFNPIALLIVAYLAVFFQATLNELRPFVGAQVDLLPSLMVYAALSGGLVPLTLLAVGGGLWMDSVSANPLGSTTLPLFVVGLVIQRNREYILRDQAYAQLMVGFSASVAVPLLTVLLLLNTEAHPLLGWFSLWQWLVVATVGACATPLWFQFFDWIGGRLNYRTLPEGGYRADREIKRGRQ